MKNLNIHLSTLHSLARILFFKLSYFAVKDIIFFFFYAGWESLIPLSIFTHLQHLDS